MSASVVLQTALFQPEARGKWDESPYLKINLDGAIPPTFPRIMTDMFESNKNTCPVGSSFQIFSPWTWLRLPTHCKIFLRLRGFL
jgi:hypothetical protein